MRLEQVCDAIHAAVTEVQSHVDGYNKRVAEIRKNGTVKTGKRDKLTHEARQELISLESKFKRGFSDKVELVAKKHDINPKTIMLVGQFHEY